jgi:hypothetical protein
LSPIRLLSHHCEYLWKRRQRFYAQVPGHSIQGGIERLSLKGRICLQPAVRIQNLIRVGCSNQDLCEKRIRIKRNRGKHLIQFLRGECRSRCVTLREGPVRDHHQNDDPDQDPFKKNISLHETPPFVVCVHFPWSLKSQIDVNLVFV